MPHPPAGEDDETARAPRRAAFGAFFLQHHLTVELFLLRLEPDRGMVEDVTQEAFMALCAKWVGGQDFTDPRTYVLAIARNILRRHQKRRGRVTTLFFDDLTMPEIAAPATPREAEDRLAAWIQLLPPRMGEVISLSQENLPDRAIAERMDISHNTVREYKVQARRKLKELAEADGFVTPTGRRRR
ncbi:RNA polymerase sigma factor [Actinoplanes sp. NPDC051475]|uniref:RNA polymerase sigma factor n=1 Tax=Actinoplanes sp. NPDC051475 TaxID=3157225 RepID=UPI00344FACCC